MTIYLSNVALRWIYGLVIGIDLVLILFTALSDLDVSFARTKLGLQVDLKEEGGFAVWFSSVLLLLNSMALFAIANNRTTTLSHSRLYGWAWRAAALVFLGLSIDETSQLHERIPYVLKSVAESLTNEYAMFGWLAFFFPLIIFFIVGMLVIARTCLGFHSRSRALVLGAVTCWAGVIIAELVEIYLVRHGLPRGLQGVVEESLEILGSTFFLIGFLDYLKATQGLVASRTVKAAGIPHEHKATGNVAILSQRSLKTGQ